MRYTLALTPTERLKALENFMNAVVSVRPVPGGGLLLEATLRERKRHG